MKPANGLGLLQNQVKLIWCDAGSGTVEAEVASTDGQLLLGAHLCRVDLVRNEEVRLALDMVRRVARGAGPVSEAQGLQISSALSLGFERMIYLLFLADGGRLSPTPGACSGLGAQSRGAVLVLRLRGAP